MSPPVGRADIWIFGYLDIWIFEYLIFLQDIWMDIWIIRVVLCPPQLAGQTDSWAETATGNGPQLTTGHLLILLILNLAIVLNINIANALNFISLPFSHQKQKTQDKQDTLDHAIFF